MQATRDETGVARAKRSGPGWRGLLLAALCTLCVGYGWLPRKAGAPNEQSRVYLSHALATRGAIEVDPEVGRWGMIYDLARRGSHYYSDKAPGSSVMAMPLIEAHLRLDPSAEVADLIATVRDYLMLPMTWLLGVALLYGLAAIGISAAVSRTTLVMLLLGTPLLHYGHAFYGHGLVATFLALTLSCFAISTLTHGARAGWFGLLAGLSAGAAFAVEYQGAVIAIGLAAGLWMHRQTRTPSYIAVTGLGVLLPVLGTLTYNALAFGSPFSTSYDHLFHPRAVALHSTGVGGITVPTLESVAGLLASPHRGLLFTAPCVLWGLLGLPALFRRAPGVCVAAGVVLAAYAYVGFASSIWWGGWGFGPRLLVPAMVAGALGFAARLEDDRQRARGAWLRAGMTLALLGCVYDLVMIPVWPELPPEFRSPVVSLLPLFVQEDVVATNLGMRLFGLEGFQSLVPLWLLALSLLAVCCVPVLRRGGSRLGAMAAVAVLACWLGVLALQPETAGTPMRNYFMRGLGDVVTP